MTEAPKAKFSGTNEVSASVISLMASLIFSTTSSSSSTPAPSASDPEPREPPGPGLPAPDVEPATGPRLTIEHLGESVATYRAPTKKWLSTDLVASKATIDVSYYLGGGAGITYPEVSLDDAAKIGLDSLARSFAPVGRLDNRTVDTPEARADIESVLASVRWQ